MIADVVALVFCVHDVPPVSAAPAQVRFAPHGGGGTHAPFWIR